MTWNVLSLGDKDSAKSVDPLKHTGQITFLCKRLLEENILVAFIQESRLALPEGFETATHKVLQNPSEKGIGGLLTIVAKDKDVKVLNHRLYGGRILTVTIAFKGTTIYAVNSHGPIRKAPESEHLAFAAQLSQALASKPLGALLVGGSDLNTRVMDTPDDVTISGPLASVCPYKARHAHQLLRALHRHGVFLANTFVNTAKGGVEVHGELSTTIQFTETDDAVHMDGGTSTGMQLTQDMHDSIATWVHPRSKKVFQIDFILTCKQSLDAISVCSTLPWAHFDVLTSSDHRAVTATFLVKHHDRKKQAQQPTRTHRSPQHLAAFKENITAKMRDLQIGPEAPPLEVTHELQSMAVEALRATKPRLAQPRKEWISQNTWKHMRLLNKLRKLLKSRMGHSTKLDHLFPLELLPAQGAPIGLALPSIVTGESWDNHATQEMKDYVNALRKLVKHLLREDKKGWFGNLCAESQGFFDVKDTLKAYEIVHQLSKVKKRRSGASLTMSDGTITHDSGVVCGQWMQYWKEHFDAEIIRGPSFSDRSMPSTEMPIGSGQEFYTSINEIQDFLKKMNKRSVAPDLCPHRYWDLLEPHLSQALMRSFNACLDQGVTPASWSGSLIIPICKPKKSATVMASHRPVQLMLMEAKLFSKLLLRNLSEHVSISWLQFARCGVFPPILASQQFISHTRDHHLSGAMIFVDISAAYDDISHQLLLGCSGHEEEEESGVRGDIIYSGFREAGMNHTEAVATRQYLLEYPHHILNEKVPPQLLKVLKHWIVSPWFQLPQTFTHGSLADDGQEVIKAKKGIRQGDGLSTFLFCLFFDIALRAIHRFVCDHTVAIDFNRGVPDVERPMMSTPVGAGIGHDTLTLLAYADDLLVPVAHEDPHCLVRQLQKLIQCLSDTFRHYQLRLNCGPQKTEICLHLASKDSRAILQFLRTQGTVASLDPGESGEVGTLKSAPPRIMFSEGFVRIVSSYKYLGRWSGMCVSPHQDMAVQRARAIESFHQHQQVLTSRRYSLSTRLFLFKSLVTCHLLQNVASYCQWPKKSVSALNGTYILLLKRI
eukprot:6490720-Amphidinium_carterae.3